MKIIISLFICIIFNGIETADGASIKVDKILKNDTRRIIRGTKSGDSEPFMVYLRPADTDPTHPLDINWLCGGVIIHELYVLTSAACIESVKHFYVISGTNKWIPLEEKNECIKNGAKKAVWKCIPIDYEFDGHQYENLRWMIDDIAVVKVEDKFNFKRRVVGCDYIPQKINFNNMSLDHEKPGTEGVIAGWGSQDHFSDDIKFGKMSFNSPVLLEAAMVLMDKEKCKEEWPEQYHYIIDNNMICAKGDTYTEKMGEFCDNDHGGPLVVGHGNRAIVIGIISACLTSNFTQKCNGPFLFTSVFKNRFLITCAIDREFSPSCRKFVFRTTNTGMHETTFNWMEHPDGPAKSEIGKQKEAVSLENSTSQTNT